MLFIRFLHPLATFSRTFDPGSLLQRDEMGIQLLLRLFCVWVALCNLVALLGILHIFRGCSTENRSILKE